MENFSPKNFSEFLKLAQKGTVVPIMSRVKADLLTPVGAYLRIESISQYSFLLESVEGGEKLARYSFLGYDPYITVRARAGKVIIESGYYKEESNRPMLDVLRQIAEQNIPVRLADMPPLVSGAVGYTVRVLPRNELMAHAAEFGLVNLA